MLIIATILTTAFAFLFAFLWLSQKRGYAGIRIGRRGGSVFAAETSFGGDFEFAESIIGQINDLNDYRIYLVCSGVPERPPNKNISDKEYFAGRLSPEETGSLKIYRQFKDISFFFLNEEVEDTEKILLTHDLIVNSAQIPDRELLLESGFIVTIISRSDIVAVTGVKGEFEKILFGISDYSFSKGRKVILSKM